MPPPRLRPLGLLWGSIASSAVATGTAHWIAGGPVAFTQLQILQREQHAVTMALAHLPASFERFPDWREIAVPTLENLSAPRPPWAGLSLDRTRIVGVLNVTPDSFSDGGAFLDPVRAIAQGRALLEAGADIVDIGGESTRPGAEPVAPEEELRRVLPAVRALAEAGALVSIDTRHAAVMETALAAGARIVNDVTALTGDPRSLDVLRKSGAAVVLMHMGGDPRTMQRDPRYDDVTLDVLDYLEARIAACEAAGIARDRIAVDPGIGFGKTLAHNLALLARLAAFHGLGTAVLLGASRKSFIAKASRGEPAEARLPGSLAAALAAAGQGVQLYRVHDVAETRQALALKERIESAG
ncbi:MAG TPA: dihydropteroate synthase [Stellaceae bacterium]|nr:dihydropteroate synthase [Stellaceae bacterium]